MHTCTFWFLKEKKIWSLKNRTISWYTCICNVINYCNKLLGQYLYYDEKEVPGLQRSTVFPMSVEEAYAGAIAKKIMSIGDLLLLAKSNRLHITVLMILETAGETVKRPWTNRDNYKGWGNFY